MVVSRQSVRPRHDGSNAARGTALVLGAASILVAFTAANPVRAEPVPASPGWRPTSWWLQLRTTGYAFQTDDGSGATLDRFGAYQSFDGAVTGLADGRVGFHASGRFADDLYLEQGTTDRSRLTSGYLDARLVRRVSARFGRQFIQQGAMGLTLDGLLLTARPARGCDVALWGGARAPLSHEVRAGSVGDDATLGARVTATPIAGTRASASWGYRERGGRVAARPLGVEASATPWRGIEATGRAAYDLERNVWDRAEALARWKPSPDLPVVAIQVVDRRPAIDAISYFARFNGIERARIARTTVRYERADRFGAEAEYVGTFVDERTSARIGAAFLAPIGRVGYSMRVGDAGEESQMYGDVSVAATPWLRVEGGATFASYALLENAADSDERDLTTAFGRLRATPRQGLGVTLEVQSLDDPLFSQDVRVLGGVDLVMGRGSGRLGLDRGPWLR